jgi:hypothetical protein
MLKPKLSRENVWENLKVKEKIYQQYTNTHRPNQKNTVAKNQKINCQTPLCLVRGGRECHNIIKQL